MTKSILIIDDDVQLANALVRVLRPIECAVRLTHTGAEGLKEAKRERPSLILLDVNLPDMLGYDVCKAVREDPQTTAIPILMMTGQYFTSSDKVKGLELGADDYIVKPFENEVLLARVEGILRRS